MSTATRVGTDYVVGREKELAELTARFDDAGPPGLWAQVVEGEPGIGKTTLWQAAMSIAQERSWRLLSCRPTGAEVQLSFAALGDLLDDALAEALPKLVKPRRRALEAALLLDEVPGRPPDRRAVALAFVDLLRLLSRSSPVLVAVDDLQWLDQPTAMTLDFALRRVHAEPIALLATVRIEREQTASTELDRVIPPNRLRRLEVGPLSVGGLHRLLRMRLGVAFPRPTLLRLHEASGGNPFYALEIARALERQPAPVRLGQPLPLPERLEKLVENRIAGLSPAVRRVLEATAALAEPTVAVVAAASVGENEFSAALQEAMGANVIALEGERMRFTHPLLATSVYSQIAPPRRRRLHRKLASLLNDPEARGRHLVLGAEAPREDVAQAAEDAARHASLRGAPSAAAELCEFAVQLTPSGGEEILRERRLAAVRYHLAAGDVRRARVLLEPLRDELSPGHERADVIALLAHLDLHNKPAQLAQLEQAAIEAAGDVERLGRIHRALGECWIGIGRSDCVLQNFRKAVALAEECGDYTGIVMATTSLALAELMTARRTPELLERALALEHEADDLLITFTPREALATVCLSEGRLEEARKLLGALLRETAAQGQNWSRLNGLRILSEVERRAGDWASATAHAVEACELILELTGEQHPWTLSAKARIDAHLGRVEDARNTAEEGLLIAERTDLFHSKIEHQAVLGFLEFSLGDAAAADRTFRPLLTQLTTLGWGISLHFPSGDALEAVLAVGELEQARKLVDQFEREADALASPWLAAAGERCRGLLYGAEGDLSGALAALHRALTSQEANGWPFERARTLLALGQTRRRAKQKRAARESLQAALAIFEELGAALWAKRARAELQRIGGRAPASGELTPSERQVAELVAEGQTNREVAAALVVTVRAVEWHLSNIYRKLGLRSRTELAHYLVTTRVAESDP